MVVNGTDWRSEIDDPDARPAPPEWEEARLEAEADAAAGRTFPIDDVLSRLRATIERLKRTAQAESDM